MTSEHFCTCFVLSCEHHPSRHEQGCDSCIQKNLRDKEIPACFWISIGGDLSNEKEFTYERFAEYVSHNRTQ